jgi:hypothetical protein
MAIHYQSIVNRLETEPLNEEELKLVKEAEEHIDNEISTKFGVRYYEVAIDNCIINFDYSPKTKKSINLKQPRKNLMSRTLKEMYVEMGWKFQYPDESDYTILKGKGQ